MCMSTCSIALPVCVCMRREWSRKSGAHAQTRASSGDDEGRRERLRKKGEENDSCCTPPHTKTHAQRRLRATRGRGEGKAGTNRRASARAGYVAFTRRNRSGEKGRGEGGARRRDRAWSRVGYRRITNKGSQHTRTHVEDAKRRQQVLAAAEERGRGEGREKGGTRRKRVYA